MMDAEEAEDWASLGSTMAWCCRENFAEDEDACGRWKEVKRQFEQRRAENVERSTQQKPNERWERRLFPFHDERRGSRGQLQARRELVQRRANVMPEAKAHAEAKMKFKGKAAKAEAKAAGFEMKGASVDTKSAALKRRAHGLGKKMTKPTTVSSFCRWLRL